MAESWVARKHLVRAPSNIALIKYMGKSDTLANLPENPSLSMTLDRLASWVSVEDVEGSREVAHGDRWVPELPAGAPPEARAPRLSSAGEAKALAHVARVRDEARRLLPEHGLECRELGGLTLRSANTFPDASGIASSASSFAAITLAVALASARDPEAFARAFEREPGFKRALASLSRRGSGSSCRSFEGPWVLWEGERAQAIAEAGMPALAHFVLLVSTEAKAVGSSEAHARVKSSPLWQGRIARVAERLAGVRGALSRGDLAALARLAWSEAWEMHSLFHTAEAPFTYWKSGSIEALEWLAPSVSGRDPDGLAPPIVTMDAGPNVHLTVRAQDASVWRERLSRRGCAVLEDRPGRGAEIIT